MQKNIQKEENKLKAQIAINKKIIESSHDAIKEIGEQVVQISEVSRVINKEARRQDEIVYTIESQLENGESNMNKGNTELRVINEHSRNRRTLICCIILILCLIVISLAIAFFIIAWFTFLNKLYYSNILL